MRINYPEKLLNELESFKQYLVLDRTKKMLVIRPDAPPGTEERYNAVVKKMNELDRLCS